MKMMKIIEIHVTGDDDDDDDDDGGGGGGGGEFLSRQIRE